MKTVSQLIASLGGAANVARHTGRTPATIRSWKHRDSIPPEEFPRLVVLAKREGASGVTLESLHAMKPKPKQGAKA